ncbi:hypothetical protein DNTS_026129 [Danionella cerebrum]|uniref:Uncharacterized protein n=1 Tax=Danionella cerebrum TaxID=2873325 RepID=A0A553QFJ0_9TELE|nr:hypothetical protein DNTS_026129 [Danionella translucida]
MQTECHLWPCWTQPMPAKHSSEPFRRRRGRWQRPAESGTRQRVV